MCQKDHEKYKDLVSHIKKIHKINDDEYHVKFYMNGIWPTCKCGCGEKVNWYYGNFRKYSSRGHVSRVENHWGHNPKAIEKSSETRRKQFANGERKMWHDGVPNDDPRKQKLFKSISNSINSNLDEIKRRSELMSLNRKNGIIPTLYGSDSSRWKGGTSEINNIARASKRLYDEWKYPILIRDGFKCVECSKSDKLHIHHNKEKFCDIVKKHMVDDCDMDNNFELKKSIVEKIIDYHVQNKVSGITLCGECHQKYHPSLNFKI